ncbi:TPA: phosphoribosyltransferase [bacterium]|nr:phosphoribosyltransferase [bacterium]
MFKDRVDAGIKLGLALKELSIQDPVVLGIPRGGVIVAVEVAKILKAPLDIAIARKIGAPFDREFAIGAVNSLGNLILNENSIVEMGISSEYVKTAVKEELEEIKRRLSIYRGERDTVDLKDRSVIIIDDGLATGLTMLSVVKGVKSSNPKETIVAVPVASSGAVERLETETKVFALEIPEYFYAVGQFYEDFHQVSDAEVISALNSVWSEMRQ